MCVFLIFILFVFFFVVLRSFSLLLFVVSSFDFSQLIMILTYRTQSPKILRHTHIDTPYILSSEKKQDTRFNSNNRIKKKCIMKCANRKQYNNDIQINWNEQIEKHKNRLSWAAFFILSSFFFVSIYYASCICCHRLLCLTLSVDSLWLLQMNYQQ